MAEIVTVEVYGSEMEVFLFRPERPGPHPALILAQHIPVGHTGIENDEFTLRTAQRFADAGYFVAVPFIFHWWPKNEDIVVKRDGSRDDWMIADMQASYNLLAATDNVDQQKIGIVGHCWGGRVAWLGACSIPALAAFAIFYGGRVKLSMGDSEVAPIALAQQITCPVIGFFGNDDKNPSPEQVDDYAAALTEAGVDFDFHRYDGVGHAFQNFPTAERYHHEQSEDAWDKVLRFFARELKQETSA